MSFHTIEQAPGRLNRSELAVPGSQPQMFEKAAQSDADVIFLDLEDAVAPDEKPQARKNIIKALNKVDWNTKTISIRINGLDTHYMYRDVVDILEQAGERLDLIMIPKVGTAADVYAVDMLVTQVEDAVGLTKRVGFEHIIETAMGMQNVSAIAGASRRKRELAFRRRRLRRQHARPDNGDRRRQRALFGADRSCRAMAPARCIGATCGTRPSPTWWSLHGPMDCDPVDGPFGDFSRPRRLPGRCLPGGGSGVRGQMGNPSQPDRAGQRCDEPVPRPRSRRRSGSSPAMAEAEAAGKGAVSLDGRLIDYASIRQAEVLVEKARQIAA